ncbi:phosphoglycerate mutase (2,3-diphosphoglycerate-independent) [Candidatus Woesebacteria bacterium RIFCSPHIGHO2_01_FULL_39_17]|uniref:2,3-bisphosphoglycerate-independent phosphoglycerate mutase n=2 Tax=Candidatus Woeseibacteriota TaxID=1752722 RepID=A0A0G0LMX1_9BACT|nr:MAG: 2,3-bisphosphoglycerate-independent phosphoglycerate mutase [Microgenomates group bacterium GW2011_GWC1_38_12]KKQ93203.1 MAG: 2,3-bisphosphoglycerate-independent phosphoglycerate mutase [Candidatus Woesebacteria bacterium GW2011_GWB1_39_10b]OGM23691.1 MAG: phosphoglycerate mutase (2,3-diphosphoglycerate-independent) [Candidatus Woesebacteria bacterium RIFCSPHIGHO2_01_FULL_39_17]OGM61148.1 MAG: phosphoglycerate mutase (2,3-diphosphoglycerate-independent) [Candidatus Woesebacteria bacteriu
MLHLPFFTKKKPGIKPTILLILDGFGLAPASEGNAITLAKTPNYDRLLEKFPHAELIASGESVGLPANEVGNTEVGHLTLGAGRVILQDLKRINLAIEKGTFFDNKAFLGATAHIKRFNSKLHIMGLVSSGNVHSSLAHLYAILQLCKKEDIKDAYLHVFTDGRDSPPKEGIEIIQQIENNLHLLRVGRIASVTGRYYAMDRDRRWDRTAKAYKAICSGVGSQAFSSLDAIKGAYLKGQSDEFIEPTVISNNSAPIATVNDNDAIIFFNYRIDRPRQLAMAFVMNDFENLKRFDFGYDPITNLREGEVDIGTTFVREKVPKNLFFVTMTEYHKKLPVSGVAFTPEVIQKPISVCLAEVGLKQLRMAESEKERFVTYYFDGMNETKLEGEDVVIVPSPKVPTYDVRPQMSLQKLMAEFKREIKRGIHHFTVVNIANSDMVAHTGNLKATIIAIEIVDKYIGELTRFVLEMDGTLFITADHGNAEELLTFPSSTYFYTSSKGAINTDHSNNPVPLIIVSNKFLGNPLNLGKGGLADVAPTILNLMGISIPKEMTGKILLHVGVQISQ